MQRCFGTPEIFLSPWSDRNELTSLWHFIVQIHVVAQLDSLRWVEVMFMVKTIDQVSSNLEFIWLFKNSFQNNKSLLCHLTDIDMSAFCVLQILLSNLNWYQNKGWNIHGGEEHAKRWHLFDFVWPSIWIFVCRCQYVDTVNTLTLSIWSLIRS